MMVVILALALGSGLAQASPKQAETASIQAGARWFKDYVDQPGDVGAYASIAFDPGNGTPWISYYNRATTALRVAHYVGSGGNCGPADDWYCEIVDNTGSVGTYSSIDVHPDLGPYPLNTRRVGVAYYDAGNGALKFAEYSCFPTCAWNIVTVQDAADYMGAPSYGQYASLKYNADGDPLIAFYANSTVTMIDDGLNYAYRVTSGGNCGVGSAAEKWQCDTVDSGDSVGQYASLDLSYLGTAFIAYYDGGAGNLRYAYYAGNGGNCGTGNAWYCAAVDGTDADVGRSASLHAPEEVGDVMKVAYYDASHGMLRYAVAVGGGGNCGPFNVFQCDDVEAVGGGPNKAISLAADGSHVPIIAYRDEAAPLGPSKLAIAQPAYSLGLLYGNCGPGSTWQCTTVDAGGDNQDEAAYVSIALDPDGLAMIAYSEREDIFGTYDLKIAYQWAAIYLPIVMRQSLP
jgi:hypothetical protein